MIIFLIFITLVFYLPIILNSSILLERGNDLQEFYWPIFYYIKEQIFLNHTLPLWNNMFFSGTPLLTDPQSFLFYLPNIIFLVLPMYQAFIVSFMLHSFFAGVGIYLVAKKGFGFSKVPSIFAAALYITFPKTAGFLEAGHFGFVASTTWLPFLLLATINLVKKPAILWSMLFAISLSGLFFTFTIIFIISAFLVSVLLFITGSYILLKRRSFRTLIFFGFGLTLTFGLTAITLLPQYEWLPQTTRYILLKDRDVYPKWHGETEFVKALFPHILEGKKFIYDLDSEKWIASGVFISSLALIGFLKLKNSLKLPLGILILVTILISLNNISPIKTFLLNVDWYVLSRVSTRIWFIIVLVLVFLAGFGLEIILKKKLKLFASILVILTIGELIALSWTRLEKPIINQDKMVPASVFEFLKNDPGQFRVFCVTRCLSQKDIAIYNLQTIEGYGTIYQKNYYDQFIQLSQVYWDKYTSTLPPISVYKFQEIQPIATELSGFNVKYVISPFKLKDPNFILKKNEGGYLIYENSLVKSRAIFGDIRPARIIKYSPNYIKIDTSNAQNHQLILSEIYSPGWIAKLDGQKEIEIKEIHNKLRSVEIEQGKTKFVEMYYDPVSFKLGKLITVMTIILMGWMFYTSKKKSTPLKPQKIIR